MSALIPFVVLPGAGPVCEGVDCLPVEETTAAS
jgi:hypothetical protein